jgi:hypothetical protein
MEAIVTLLGIGVRIDAGDARLLDAALAALGAWAQPARGDADPPITLRLRLSPGSLGDDAPRVEVDGPRLAMTGAAQGRADAVERIAECAVPAGYLADPPRLAAEVVDPLALFLLTRYGRVPLHAAGILVDGTAVLLAGRSGSGKSTLALTALGDGRTVLSDDTVYVQTRPALRVWGLPRPIHVFEQDARAAARESAGTRLRNGRLKSAIDVDHSAVPPSAERAVLFLLERGDSVAVHRITRDDAVDGMEALLEPGFDHFRHVLPETVRAVSAGGAWRLTLSADPRHALRAVVDAVRGA